MKSIFGDIQSKKLIVLKGFLFLLAGLIAVGVLIGENFSYRNAFLLGVAIWSFCRFYYFAFYVIETPISSSQGCGRFGYGV
jgi:hypothetical protein